MLQYTVSRVQWWEGWSGVETMAPGTKWWSCTVIRTIKPWLLGDHVSLLPTGWRDNQHLVTLPSIITSNILLVSRFMLYVLSDKYFFLLKTNVTQGLCRCSLSITKQCPGHMCACYIEEVPTHHLSSWCPHWRPSSRPPSRTPRPRPWLWWGRCQCVGITTITTLLTG